MIVIAIIGVLAASLFPVYMNYVHKAEMTAAKVFISKFQYLEPVLHYDFDTQSGTTVIDKSGKNNIGIMNGGTYSTDVPYGSGYSYSFTGVLNTQAQYIQSSQNIALVQEEGFTVMYWIKMKPNESLGGYIVANTAGASGYRANISVGGSPYFLLGNGSGWREMNCTNSIVNDGRWHHVAFSFDTSKPQMICFVDGKQKQAIDVPISIVGNISTAATFIGSISTTSPSSALVDDVQIRWGVVLR